MSIDRIKKEFIDMAGALVREYVDVALGKGEFSSADFNARCGHRTLVFDNKIWLLGGSQNHFGSNSFNDVWYSTDGTSWTQATSSATFPPRGYFSSFVYNDKMWIVGGINNSSYSSDMWYSYDGVTWTQSKISSNPSTYLSNAVPLVFENKVFLIGGYGSSMYYNDIWQLEFK